MDGWELEYLYTILEIGQSVTQRSMNGAGEHTEHGGRSPCCRSAYPHGFGGLVGESSMDFDVRDALRFGVLKRVLARGTLALCNGRDAKNINESLVISILRIILWLIDGGP